MGAAAELFLSGLALGLGPCMVFCLPILVPFIAGTRQGGFEGLKATLTFSLSRLAAYTLLGLLAGFSGELLIGLLVGGGYSLYAWTLGGALISLMGVLIIVGAEPRLGQYDFFSRFDIGSDLKGLALLGFLVGATPCGPLLGVLTHIALTAETPVVGGFYALCFGLGAAIVTPVTLLGVLSGAVPPLIFRDRRVVKTFRVVCGLMLVVIGARHIVSQLWGDAAYW
ncbi:MAG: sulfite exporter TauE/SafE family protein [Candidatus Bathyarchaeota archaeon]|nr:MAG: sulfite exporter TauE/SafE family protein [Candidatus Bathyarchaeota archaeon]